LSSDIALNDLLRARTAQLAERAPRSWALIQAKPDLRDVINTVLLGSDFVHRSLIQDDELLASLHASGGLSRARSRADYTALLGEMDSAALGDEVSISRALRRVRRQEMVRLVWRELTGVATLHECLRETSWFADSAIVCAVNKAKELLAAKHGHMPDESPGLLVLGMGKLGGEELNFSSDIDLVFLFTPGGESSGPAALPAEEYYTRLGRIAIRLLDAQTADGFVFRVDMRLRPFGDSGPLVASVPFFEDYLQAHGRDWERYAYIKARAVTCADLFASVYSDMLRPFVYRRYLDFGVFESLREMKALITRDVARRERGDNLKLGPGGIREIEFIAQAMQLVRGGQEASLREASLLKVLPRLAGAKLLPESVVLELQAAYDFLRKLENRVQMLDDAQVHSIPTEPLACERIAQSLGFADSAALLAQLGKHRTVVSQHFAALFEESNGTRGSELPDLSPLWEPSLDRAALLEQLHSCSDEPAKLLSQLEELSSGSRLRLLGEAGRRRLKALLELLLGEQKAARHPETLRRVFSVLEAIGQRSAYFSLLVESRRAREQLVHVCGMGSFLAAQLARNPALLDELQDERWEKALPGRDLLQEELAARMAEVASGDVEREVEALCRFKQVAMFRVALADLSGRLPLMSVSDRLTEIAEVIVHHALQLAWQQITTLLGTPPSVTIAVLAYGKFGGHELGYGSDLDLVFIHDSPQPLENQVFFLRFGQRIVHLLTVHTSAGRLYEVDTRLRPSGKGGLMITSLEAFRRYQFEEAWTWEHQALLHARAVAGDSALCGRLDALRIEVLQQAVRRDDLQTEVREMRARMRRELSNSSPGQFDLKQDAGGVADIEFLAQYWALRWAADYPPLVHFSDTIRQLESVASAGLVPQETVDQLVAAYQHYRSAAHRLSLESLGGIVSADEFTAERAAVSGIWRAIMGETV
jgi:[glutamine synthetase] adenylyltransferase / [glutamine synthetase]-adenylyl-L-tyrosine phosphorylase